jgi:hypothetical protein
LLVADSEEGESALIKEAVDHLYQFCEKLEMKQKETENRLVMQLQAREENENRLLLLVDHLEALNSKMQTNIDSLAKKIQEEMKSILAAQNETPSLLKQTIEDVTKKNIGVCFDNLGITTVKINEITSLQATTKAIEVKIAAHQTDNDQKTKEIMNTMKLMEENMKDYTKTSQSKIAIDELKKTIETTVRQSEDGPRKGAQQGLVLLLF